MRISNFREYASDPIDGGQPEILWGIEAPNGASGIWKEAAAGSIYVRRVAAGHVCEYMKAKSSNSSTDWVVTEGRILVTLTKSLFTDGGAAAGTYATGLVIPAGVTVEPFILNTTTAWNNNTSAELDVGDGTDADRFNSATAPSIFATGVVSGGTPSGTNPVATAATLTVTITGSSDFTNVASGTTVLSLRYRG